MTHKKTIRVKSPVSKKTITLDVVSKKPITSLEIEEKVILFTAFCNSSSIPREDMLREAQILFGGNVSMSVSKTSSRECWFMVGGVRVPKAGMFISKQ
jgi:hypothetical protein